MRTTMWDVINYRCWCGEDDFESASEICEHDRMHDRQGEQPGDPYVGARVAVGDEEGTVTEIKDGYLYVSWDDCDLACELKLDAVYRVLDPWA